MANKHKIEPGAIAVIAFCSILYIILQLAVWNVFHTDLSDLSVTAGAAGKVMGVIFTGAFAVWFYEFMTDGNFQTKYDFLNQMILFVLLVCSVWGRLGFAS